MRLGIVIIVVVRERSRNVALGRLELSRD